MLTVVVEANSPTADQSYSVPQAEVLWASRSPVLGKVLLLLGPLLPSWMQALLTFTVAQLVPRSRVSPTSVGGLPCRLIPGGVVKMNTWFEFWELRS